MSRRASGRLAVLPKALGGLRPLALLQPAGCMAGSVVHAPALHVPDALDRYTTRVASPLRGQPGAGLLFRPTAHSVHPAPGPGPCRACPCGCAFSSLSQLSKHVRAAHSRLGPPPGGPTEEMLEGEAIAGALFARQVAAGWACCVVSLLRSRGSGLSVAAAFCQLPAHGLGAAPGCAVPCKSQALAEPSGTCLAAAPLRAPAVDAAVASLPPRVHVVRTSAVASTGVLPHGLQAAHPR